MNNKRYLFDPDLLDGKSETELWFLIMNIKNYTTNSDGSVDVDGDVDISNQNLNK